LCLVVEATSVSNPPPEGETIRVYCNGTTLLKDFDILKQPSDGAMVVFDHVKLSAHDMLELYFTPVTKYPIPAHQRYRSGT
jgi:hypothetical protein